MDNEKTVNVRRAEISELTLSIIDHIIDLDQRPESDMILSSISNMLESNSLSIEKEDAK